jgi:ornithine carbamoyltransferase
MRNFIAITDFTSDELTEVLERADQLRALWHNHAMPQILRNRNVALWFYGNGFRNRVAFEIGTRAMGADVSFLPGELGIHEPIQDIGHYLHNWFSMLVIRARYHKDLIAVARDASVPIINARTNHNHPCEIMGDLQYIRNVRGSIEDLAVVFVGEVTNLCMSWFEAAIRFSLNVVQVAPDKYLYPDKELKKLNQFAVGNISTTNDLNHVVSKKTDVLYTDCWPKNDDNEHLKNVFLPYQINEDIVDRINDQGFFLPCPPVTRGQEVTEGAMASEKCKNYEAKEYLLHSQNAVIEFLVRENGL